LWERPAVHDTPKHGSWLNARVTWTKDCPATEADGDDDPERTTSLSVGESTSDGQRFRLLRPHTRGGLGEVFVALDAELHRRLSVGIISCRRSSAWAFYTTFLALREKIAITS
jgi:hypothetical protein